MHVGGIGLLIGHTGDFKIVCRKQGQRAVVCDEALRDGPCKRQAIIGRGTATDFIHQHQTVCRARSQDRSGFGHFHHKGRASTRKIVSGTNACKYSIQGPDGRCTRRHKASDSGKQGDQGDLTHIGGFTTHIWTRDHEQGAVRVEAATIGRKAFDRALHDRVATCCDFDRGVFEQAWGNPVVVLSVMRERDQHVELCTGARTMR